MDCFCDIGNHRLISLVGLWLSMFMQWTAYGETPYLNYNKNLTFVTGTYTAYLEDPLFYDSYVPLLFEFPVPLHTESAIKIMWQHAAVCNESDSRYNGMICPIVHHLHKVITNLTSDMGFWKDFIPLNADHDGIAKIPDPDCETITSHFGSFVTTSEEIGRYSRTLGRCPLEVDATPISLSPNWIINKQIYYTMLDRFYSEYFRNLPGTGSVDWVITMNSYTALQGVLLTNNYVESNRIMNAFIECQNGRIPQAFVKISDFQKHLRALQSKLSKSHYKLVIDKENEISRYFALPLSDCTFTEDFKLVIRVLAPVKEIEKNAKLVQIRAFPFVEKLQNTSVENPLRLCQIQGPGTVNLVETDSDLLLSISDNCRPGELCKRSELDSFLPLDACTSSILSRNNSMIKSYCKVNCFPIDRKSLPIFHQNSSDTFIAIGISDDKIFIQCNGQPLEKIGLPNVGALEIRLSCNCQITYRNMRLQPGNPCTNDPISIRHVLPLQWDFKMNDSTSYVDISENIILDLLEKQERDNLGNYYYGHGHHDLRQANDGDDFKKDNQASVEALKDNSTPLSAGMIAQISILWLFVMILLLSNSFLLYNTYHLNKWKKLQLYQDTRIVYNVPESPKFPTKF